MKTAFQGDNVDYSSFFPQSLDPLTWNLNHDSSNMNVGSTSVSPSISPPSSAVPSPSAITNSPVALQEVSLQIPTSLQVGSMSPSMSPMPLSSFAVTGNIHKTSSSYRKKMPPPPSKAGYRAPIVKPSPAEEELVRRIHRKVGGPAKLSTYDDPAKVRHVVIEALANEQADLAESSRVRKGQLTVFERRVVRTVTNRGAAVRSRMRQRKEMDNLRKELVEGKKRVNQLETVVRSLCSVYGIPIPPLPPIPKLDSFETAGSSQGMMTSGPDALAPSLGAADINAAVADVLSSQRGTLDNAGRDSVAMGLGSSNQNDIGLQQPIFGCLTDNGVTHMPWS